MKLTTELENNACFYVDGEKGKEMHVQKKNGEVTLVPEY